MGQITCIDAWLQAAIADAERRNLPDLTPLLTGLAHATRALRAADFNETATGGDRSPHDGRQTAADSRPS